VSDINERDEKLTQHEEVQKVLLGKNIHCPSAQPTHPDEPAILYYHRFDYLSVGD
jgi:hypothetical protein